MKQLQKKEFTEKEMQKMKQDLVKSKDLEFLKSHSYHGPFSSKEVIKHVGNHQGVPRNSLCKNDKFIVKIFRITV